MLRDYELFVEVAESLGRDGFKTLSVAKKSDFQNHVLAYHRDHPLVCPNPSCGAPRANLRLVYTMEAVHKIRPEPAPDLYVADNNTWEEPSAGSHPELRCLRCGARSPVRKGTTVFLMRDGKKHRLFEPDHL